MSIDANPRGPALIVAAHPDDGVLGAGGWVCGYGSDVTVAFLTDGVPHDPAYFAPGYTDPAAYRAARRREAIHVWRRLCPRAHLYFGAVIDQNLAFDLSAAAAWLQMILVLAAPALVLAPAFEGGHPDHDAANFLVALLARPRLLPVWEYALYTAWHGEIRRLCFPENLGERPAPLVPAVLARKRRALAGYRSQRAVLAEFDPAAESLRHLPDHDYLRPPRAEACVYERWGWPIRAQAVATAFAAYTKERGACAFWR